MWSANNFTTAFAARFPARTCLLLAGLLLTGLLVPRIDAVAGDIYEHILTRPQWPQHANGHNIAALPAVTEALRRFKENGKITIVIRYPGGDPGRQWADELYGWLVSFGIPTRYLELEPGSGGADRLVVGVIDRG